MHARELIELAAIVAAHGPALVFSPEPIPAAGIEQYWTASKVRLDRWARRLKASTKPTGEKGTDRAVLGVLEEILTGEMLTRAWTATLCAYDKHRGDDRAEPAARSVLIGHIEAQHHALTLMVREPDAEHGRKLNRLRRRVERWTDLLVGHLVTVYDVSEFAFDAERARDFASDLRDQCSRRGGNRVWPLLTASVRMAFQQELSPQSPNGDLNAQIADSILHCFPASVFDSTGIPNPLWLMRLMSAAEDTQVLIDDLLGSRPASVAQQPGRSPNIANRRPRGLGGR